MSSELELDPDDPALAEAWRQTRRSRAKRWAWVLGGALHGVALVLLLVVPNQRAQLRAEVGRDRYAAFAACLWGGTPTAEPGLGLPAGERAGFATQYLQAARDWPSRCASELEATAPDEAWYLLPSARTAESDVRAAVDVAREELAALGTARDPTKPVPERFLRANAQVLGTLALWAEETGFEVDPRNVAFELPSHHDGGEAGVRGETGLAVAGLVEPARVPLGLDRDAVVFLWVRGDGVEAAGVDGRAVGWVRSGGGRTEHGRSAREGPVRGFVLGRERPLAVFATAPDRCADDRCLGRALGIGLVGTEPVRPSWLAVHPFGTADGSVAASVEVAGESVRVIAVYDEPALALAELAVPALADPDEPEPARAPPDSSLEGGEELLPERPERLTALARSTVRSVASFVGSHVVWSVDTEEDVGFYALASDALDRPADELARFSPGGPPFVHRCDGHVLFGVGERARVAAHGEGRWRMSEPFEHGFARATAKPALACQDGELHAFALGEEGAVQHVYCDADLACASRRASVGSADHVAAAPAGDRRVVVAVSRGGPVGVTTVVGREIGPVRAVAACWEGGAGLCGAPLAAAQNGRVLIAGRENADLRVVETTDGGRTFRTMRGIR
jgi:hypothetical protein